MRGKSKGVQGPWGGGVPNFPDGHKETIPTTKELVRGRGAETRLIHEYQNKIPRGGGGGGLEAAKESQTGCSCDPKIKKRIPVIKISNDVPNEDALFSETEKRLNLSHH